MLGGLGWECSLFVALKMANDEQQFHHHSSFGCHVADSNVAPGCCVKVRKGDVDGLTHCRQCHIVIVVSHGLGWWWWWCGRLCSVKTKVKWSHQLLTGRSCEVMLVSSKSCGTQGWISKISQPDWSRGIVTCKLCCSLVIVIRIIITCIPFVLFSAHAWCERTATGKWTSHDLF